MTECSLEWGFHSDCLLPSAELRNKVLLLVNTIVWNIVRLSNSIRVQFKAERILMFGHERRQEAYVFKNMSSHKAFNKAHLLWKVERDGCDYQLETSWCQVLCLLSKIRVR